MNSQDELMAQILRGALAVCPWTGDLISLFFSFLLHLVVVTIVHTLHSLGLWASQVAQC